MNLTRTKSRRRSHCQEHDWSSTMVIAGLRRDVCSRCDAISIEAVSHQLFLPESLRRVTQKAG